MKLIINIFSVFIFIGIILSCSAHQTEVDYPSIAEQGDVDAQLCLGKIYFKGEGVAIDFKQSLYWYTKAAEQGNSIGQFFLGLMYYEGKGVSVDYKQAIYWFNKAAEQGYDDAQLYLGKMYYNGEGVTKDYIKAYAWLNLVASQEDTKATRLMDSALTKMSSKQIEEGKKLSNKIYENIYKQFNRRYFHGFTVVMPDSENWIITEKNNYSISFIRKIVPSPKHSIIALAALNPSPYPLDSNVSLKELIEKTEKLGEADKRYKNYRYNISDIRVSGRDCVKSVITTEDHGVPNEWGSTYILEGVTVYCIHPMSSSLVVTTGYSQRYKKGKRAMTLENEMQQFFKSIQFEQFNE